MAFVGVEFATRLGNCTESGVFGARVCAQSCSRGVTATRPRAQVRMAAEPDDWDAPNDKLFDKGKMEMLYRLIDSAKQSETLERELADLGLADLTPEQQKLELLKMLKEKTGTAANSEAEAQQEDDEQSDEEEVDWQDLTYDSGTETSLQVGVVRESGVQIELSEVYAFVTRVGEQQAQIFTMRSEDEDMVVVFESETDATEFMGHLANAAADFSFYKLERLALSEVLETCDRLGYELGLIEEGGLGDLNMTEITPSEAMTLTEEELEFQNQVEKRNVNPELRQRAEELNQLFRANLSAEHVDESENFQ
ncbi:hypothetical protein FVE85_6069 [Porphyridium purpureum]|uniref:Uncharacterized protein n=1 Tax=Porphyridium purpureum TaxID=35688 RepID=A0A5J4Z669_PORPP|nr:hypothetical protein FVE85_6069 [Porphyridium purpureum]|eukprot:POR5446..scf295_1